MCLYCQCSYKIWEVETEFLGTRRPTSILGERTKKHFVQSKMGRADQLLELPLDTWWALHSHTHCTCALRHASAHTLTHMHIHVHTQRSYSKYFGWNYFRDKAGLLSHVFQCPLPRTVSPAALPDEIPFVDQTQNWDPTYLFFRMSPVPLVSSWLPSIENWLCQPCTVV